MATFMMYTNMNRVVKSSGICGNFGVIRNLLHPTVTGSNQGHATNRFWRCYSSKVGPYYVLLPEIPPDTPESNAIMRFDQYPKFSEITPDKTVTGCAKLAIEFDVNIGKNIDSLNSESNGKTFDKVFDGIERLAVPLNYAWRTAKHLNYTCAATGFKDSFSRIHPQVERAKNERWINQGLFHAVKEVHSEYDRLNDEQKRLVDMYLLEAKLNGINLTGNDKKQFVQVLGKLIDGKNHFRNRVMLSHNLFSHTIHNVSEIAEMPRELLREFAVDKSNPSKGPWRITLNHSIYELFLQYCGHRTSRWNVWQARNNRASIGQDEQNLSNHIIIEQIREYRRDVAKLLGYNSFAEMSMETKMAGSIEAAVEMLNSIKKKLLPAAESEIVSLQEFARSEGFKEKLQMWDVLYWRRRQRDHLYNVNPAEIAQSFPYPTVLNYLFQICKKLFGIDIVESTGEVDIWHPTVKFYKVLNSDDSRQIAAFYLDPYLRPTEKMGGMWMESGRERSGLLNVTPFSYLNLNLPPPLGAEPPLLSLEHVYMLFHEFGHGLQQMLTTVSYSEIAGQRNVEWDSLQTSAKLMMFLAQHRSTLSAISQQSGKPLSSDTLTNIVSVQRHMSAYDTMRHLYHSALDLELYVSSEHWQRILPRIWEQYLPMIPLNEDDNHPCSLTAIFSDQYPAAYYSIKWSEMLAADIFEAFTDAGIEKPESAAAVGQKFRKTYLELGGGVSASEVFRRFRGRNPSVDPLVERHLSNAGR